MDAKEKNNLFYLLVGVVVAFGLGVAIASFSGDESTDYTIDNPEAAIMPDGGVSGRPTGQVADPTPSTPDPTPQSSCLTAQQAWSNIGRTACVSYFVANPFQSGKGNVFLNEKRDYKNGFTTVIFANSGLTSGAVSNYGQKTIEVSGTIGEYEGHPQIIVNDLSQIQVVN